MGSGSAGRPTYDTLTLESGKSAGYLIRRAQQRHTRLWGKQFGGEVTGPQLAVAMVVASEPGLDQRAIGERASLDKSSIADVVARLHRGGWLEVAAASDARRKALTLTPLARTALVELARRAALVQDALLAPLGPGCEREAFLHVLQVVAFQGQVPPPVHDVAAPPGAHVPMLTLHTAPGHLLRRAQQMHTAIWGAEVDGPLSSPQYAVLNALAAHPEGLDQSTVGELSSLDKSNLADIIERLVARAWVQRHRHPLDGRRRVLTITEDARQELERLAPAVRRVQARLLQPLDEADRQQFTRGARLLAYGDTSAPAVDGAG